MEKVQSFLYKCIEVLAILIFGWLMILLFFCSDSDIWTYACKKFFLIGNISIILFLFVGLLIWFFVGRKKAFNIKCFQYDRIVNFVTPILLLVEIYICYNIFFETGWDPGYYIIPTARALVVNEDITVFSDTYFSMFPNNLLLVHIYYVILKLNSAIGVFGGEYQLMSIVVCNCVISTLTCRLIYSIVCQKMEIQYGFIAFFISAVLLGLSPWMVICYSDSFGVFIPVLILYIYIKKNIPYYIRYPLIFILGYLGYYIKPQVLIMVIAIIIVICLRHNNNNMKEKIKKGFIIILISGIVISTLASVLQKKYINEGFDTNSDRKFGMSHYLMMGLNPNSLGIYDLGDVELSASCKNQEERGKKNLEIAKERLELYGVKGYMQFLSKKMLTNYNDGTFAWGVEGGFYSNIKQDINSKMAVYLKKLYYNNGEYFSLYSTTVQFVWITILVFIMMRTFFAISNKKKDYDYMVMILSIIGLTFFELLFEARARYLFIYIPIYIILGVYGMKNVNEWMKEKLERRIIDE